MPDEFDDELNAALDLNQNIIHDDRSATIYHDDPSIIDLFGYSKVKTTPESTEVLTKSMLGEETTPVLKVTVDDEEVNQLIKDMSGEEPETKEAFVRPDGDEFKKLKKDLRQARIDGDDEESDRLEKLMYGKVLDKVQ